MSYKKYTPSDTYTYAFGMFPTLEALTHAPHLCRAVLYQSRATKSEALTKIEALCEAHHIPFLLDEKTVSRLAPSDNTFVMTVVDKPATPLAPHANHLVLVSPSDMGNLGTIFRTALGFGMTHIALIQPCADYHDPRAVRASMGAIFSLHINKYPTFEAYRAQFPHHTLYPTMTTSANPLASVLFATPYAVIFGNESAGLPPEFATMGHAVVIPHTQRIDSLNLAVSVGIVLYHTALSDPSTGEKPIFSP